MKNRIIDTVIFNDELDLLHMRLDYLYDIVDWFIIVESLDSFSKKVRKQRYVYESNQGMFEKYKDKILYYKIYKLPFDSNNIAPENKYKNEEYQRDACGAGLYDLSLKNQIAANDWVIHSDIDEIPNRVALMYLQSNTANIAICRMKQKLFYYNVNVLQNQEWYGPVGMRHGLSATMSFLRENRNNPFLFTFNDGGWHYSYMGGVDRIQRKMLSYSESDDNNAFSNIDNIKNSIDNVVDLLGRTDDMFVKTVVDIGQPGMAPDNIFRMVEIYPYLLRQ